MMLSLQGGKIILFTKPMCNKVFAGFNIFVSMSLAPSSLAQV